MEAGIRIVFFDGRCPFCVGWIKFLLDRDGANRLRFASLQSAWSARFFEERGMPHPGMGSVLVWDGEQLHKESDALIELSGVLGGIWRAGRVARHVPAGIRDGIYNFIGARRIQWFGKYDACWLPKAGERQKFLDSADPVYADAATGGQSRA
jgi:predicted DCC family thiol-disulfide oxidoreductase YuxK